MRYKFTGTSEEEFPSVVTSDGVVLVAQPGQIYDLVEAVDHARLAATDKEAKSATPITEEPK